MKRLTFCLAILFLIALSASAQEFPKRIGFVNDFAHFLSQADNQALNYELTVFQERTGAEIIVLTVPSIQKHSLESFAGAIDTFWYISQSGKKSVLFLVAKQERLCLIYPAINTRVIMNDATIGKIMADKVVPSFKTNDMVSGIKNGTHAIMKVFDPSG